MKFHVIAALLLMGALQGMAQSNKEAIKKEDFIAPADLAKQITANQGKDMVIFNVGPMGNIKGAIQVGALNTPEGLTKFKAEVDKLNNKAQKVVVYCGCCTSDNCPNIRPAYEYLIGKGFKDANVLFIEHGFVEDWQGKEYPMQP